MVNKMEEKPDFSDFEKSTFSEWKAAISKELKGRDAESISWENELGFTISPYSRPESNEVVKATQKSMWEVHMKFDSTDFKELNRRILWALNHGTNSIEVNLEKIPVTELAEVLEGVMISYISVKFAGVKDITELANWLRKRANSENVDAKELRGVIESENYQVSFFEEFAGFSFAISSSNEIHNKGASAIQEIVWNLNHLHEFILKGHSMSFSPKFQVTFGIGNEFYVEIAKLRVFRLLWSKIAEAYSYSGELFLAGVTSLYYQTAIDENNNTLRATSQAISSIAGGIDTLCILPADAYAGEWNQNSSRIALNIHHLMMDEAHLNEYRNAAKGSWFMRDLEQKLADKAWRYFVKWEENGGILRHPELFMSNVKNQHVNRKDLVDKGTKMIIGVNKYPGSLSDKASVNSTERLSESIERLKKEEVR